MKDVTFILPVENESNKFVIGHDRDLDIVTWDGQSDAVSKIEKYVKLEPEEDVRMNDGKTSPSGVIVVGIHSIMCQSVRNGATLLIKRNTYTTEIRKKLLNRIGF